MWLYLGFEKNSLIARDLGKRPNHSVTLGLRLCHSHTRQGAGFLSCTSRSSEGREAGRRRVHPLPRCSPSCQQCEHCPFRCHSWGPNTWGPTFATYSSSPSTVSLSVVSVPVVSCGQEADDLPSASRWVSSSLRLGHHAHIIHSPHLMWQPTNQLVPVGHGQ